MYRKRNIRNLISGVSFQLINTLLALLLPYLFITYFGSESNGLLNSVAQLFVCLELLEAGVGTATVQALYEPIAKNDKDGINHVLAATNIYYHKTGVIYALSVMVIAIVYPVLVDSQLEASTIRLVVILQGLGNIVGYFFQSKYILLLRSEGKIYILNIAQTTTTLFRNFGKIVVIYLGLGIVAVQSIQLASSLLQCLIIVFYVKVRYKWINLSTEPAYSALRQKGAVLVQSFSWMVFNHTDMLLLTILARDLILVSIYSVYLMVYSCIQNFLESIYSSFQYGVGLAAQQSKKQLNMYYSKYRIFNLALAIALYLVVYIMIESFLSLYTANIKDANYLLPGLAVLFLILKVLNSMRALNKHLIEAVGHFQETRHIPILEMSINLIVSITCIFKYGIYGVLIGTIAALTVSEILYIVYNSRHILNISISLYLLDYLFFIAPSIVIIYFCKQNIVLAKTYVGMILQAIPLTGFIIVIYGLLAFGRLKIDQLYFRKAWL